MQKIIIAFFSMWLLSTCSSLPRTATSTRGASPKEEAPSRYGNPDNYKVFGKTYQVKNSSKNHTETGHASWYGKDFHGKRTSSGETYNMHAYTAAHKTLPIPTYVLVTNLENGKQITVQINDRGPFKSGRIIDLSYAAAKELDIIQKGTAKVQIEALPPFQNLNNTASPPKKASKKTPIPKQPIAQDQYDIPSSNAKYAIQLGAFNSIQNAESFRHSLQLQINKSLQIIQQKGMYRIIFGPFTTKEEATKASSTLKVSSIIIPL